MISRSASLLCCLLLMLLSLRPAGAVEGDLLDQMQPLGDAAVAVDRGLQWLREQQGDNGLFSERYRGALSALVLIAHAAAGITPQESEHGAVLRAALVALLEEQDADGYFGKKDASRMYGHGIVTLCLALCVGCSGDDRLDERVLAALHKAVVVIERAVRIDKDAAFRGGWRYEPGDRNADASVSVWQVQALAAAAQTGVPVSEAVLEEAGAFLLRLCGEDGSVGYERPGEDRSSLQGSMLLALSACGQERQAVVQRIVARLMAEEPGWRGPWFFNRSSSSALALCRLQPEGWREHLHKLTAILIEQQDAEGWWPKPPGDNEGDNGRVYSTALAIITLCAERFCLPPYQP